MEQPTPTGQAFDGNGNSKNSWSLVNPEQELSSRQTEQDATSQAAFCQMNSQYVTL